MAVLLFVIVGFLAIGAVGGAFLFVRARNIFREQKNYERGLKMVPLLIHLPPPSDDINSSNRDDRELDDENISRAQVLYNIIASTIQKGFKSKVYGQRHIAFEIVAQKGFVHYYAAVPVALVPVVQQAVVSAYPSARLEEVAEHNIFSPVGRISGTIGGELVLKENYAYSIATYQDLKRDAMQSLLNALSTLEKEDGAGLQILFRPADPGWRKKAGGLASKKRKGKESSKGLALAGTWGREIISAPFKPPEGKDGEKKPDEKQLSSLEQSIVDSIDDKTRYPGYEVLIRVVASSNVASRAQSVLSNIVATFALFDSPGKNGFKYIPARDIENFVTGYIMRFFPQENKSNILNVVELATIFHFPDQRNIPTSQLERQASKQVDGPRNIMDEGMLLGYNLFRGTKKAIRLSHNDRRRHIYVVGQTGTGKSTFLENLALQDMLDGKGFAFVDPHGDTAEKLLSMVPKERTEDVIYFCPAEMDYPLGLNLFEFHSPEQKDFLIQEAINMLYKLYDPQHQGIIGPRYEHWFRNAALTLMSDPGGSTFIDIPKLFTDNAYAAEKKKHVTDQTVLDFWNKEMAQTADFHKSEVLGWFVSKFSAFLSNEMMRNIIGQTKSSFNMREIMDNKKILLVNLSKGRTGELNSKLLGMIFVMKFQAAAMSRASIPEEDRVDFCLYVDEFQNFSTDSFADILSEARKYRLNLIVANQFTTQLTDQIRDAVFGNVGTIVAHRVGTADAEALVKVFQPVFDVDDLQRIPNYNAVMRMLINGVPTQPFSLADLPPLGSPNKQLGDALKQLSAAKYGRPKAVVDAEISKRLATQEPPKPAVAAGGGAFGQSPFGRPAAGGAGGPSRPAPGAFKPPVAKPTTGSSFLDDWLNKKGSPVPAANTFGRQQAFSPPAPQQMATPPIVPPVAAPAAQPVATPPSSQPSGPSNAYIQSSAVPTQSDDGDNTAPIDPLAAGAFAGDNAAAAPPVDAAPPSEAPSHKLSVQPSSDFLDSYLRKRASGTLPPDIESAANALTPAQDYEQGTTDPAEPLVGTTKHIKQSDVFPPATPPVPAAPVVATESSTPESESLPEDQQNSPVSTEQDGSAATATEPEPQLEAEPKPVLEPELPVSEIPQAPTAEPVAQAATDPLPAHIEAPVEDPLKITEETGESVSLPELPPSDEIPLPQPVDDALLEEQSDLVEQELGGSVDDTKSDSLEVNIRNNQPADTDTIFIDQDGNLYSEEEKAARAAAANNPANKVKDETKSANDSQGKAAQVPVAK